MQNQTMSDQSIVMMGTRYLTEEGKAAINVQIAH